MKRLFSVSCFLLATLISGFVVAQAKVSSGKNSGIAKAVETKNYGLSNPVSLGGSKTENQKPGIVEPEKALVKKEEVSLPTNETTSKSISNKIESRGAQEGVQENIQPV